MYMHRHAQLLTPLFTCFPQRYGKEGRERERERERERRSRQVKRIPSVAATQNRKTSRKELMERKTTPKFYAKVHDKAEHPPTHSLLYLPELPMFSTSCSRSQQKATLRCCGNLNTHKLTLLSCTVSG